MDRRIRNLQVTPDTWDDWASEYQMCGDPVHDLQLVRRRMISIRDRDTVPDRIEFGNWLTAIDAITEKMLESCDDVPPDVPYEIRYKYVNGLWGSWEPLTDVDEEVAGSVELLAKTDAKRITMDFGRDVKTQVRRKR